MKTASITSSGTPSSAAATNDAAEALSPMADPSHQNAEDDITPVLSSASVTATATATAPVVPTAEVVNLRPPAKLPSRPRKLRKLSPEKSESSMKSRNNCKIVTRPRLISATHQRSMSCEGEIENALNHLRTADSNLAKLIDIHPPPTFDSYQTPFLALTKSILYQQLAYKAGTSIYSRFVALCGGESGVVPATVLALTPQQLRQIGVSGRKTSYLHDLAKKYQNGILSDSAIINMDDKSLFTMLTMVNGIGSWSVHMFMIFALHRPDVLPVNDLGIRKGVQLLYGLEDLPRPSQMDQLCEKWRPYRSVASWYIWRFVEAKGAPTSSAVVTTPAAGMSLMPQQQLSPLQSPHQQQQSQHQPQFLDPMNGIINIGQLS
ncbi:DNA-3-methyladenine glycosylase 1-like [Chenopodium quinoa]|uniref:DNA-3-methyladenine glycosylase 1-like n=1 Tax=Chenopodium quinoa TaxID=63459 RepID=UPI000B77DD14|nr:DNA-3-methyladenine glycosylase 1-like [Chenopodium quinoa]